MKIYYAENDLYPATYNFRDEVGLVDTDISLFNLIAGADTGKSATVIASEDGHRAVVKFVANGDNGQLGGWYRTSLTETGTLTIEMHIKYIDLGVGWFYITYYNESAATIIEIGINSTTNLLYYTYGNMGFDGNAAYFQQVGFNFLLTLNYKFNDDK